MPTADLSAWRGFLADVATAWRGARRFLDPRGRASRTELFLLPAFLAALGFLFFAIIALFTLDFGLSKSQHLISAIVLVPIPAAAARRFHDIGKSGWFALPVVLMCAVGIWDAWKDWQAGPHASHDLWGNNAIAEVMFSGLCLFYVALLLQPPRDEGNPYGPNPRPAPKII